MLIKNFNEFNNQENIIDETYQHPIDKMVSIGGFVMLSMMLYFAGKKVNDLCPTTDVIQQSFIEIKDVAVNWIKSNKPIENLPKIIDIHIKKENNDNTEEVNNANNSDLSTGTNIDSNSNIINNYENDSNSIIDIINLKMDNNNYSLEIESHIIDSNNDKKYSYYMTNISKEDANDILNDVDNFINENKMKKLMSKGGNVVYQNDLGIIYKIDKEILNNNEINDIEESNNFSFKPLKINYLNKDIELKKRYSYVKCLKNDNTRNNYISNYSLYKKIITHI